MRLDRRWQHVPVLLYLQPRHGSHTETLDDHERIHQHIGLFLKLRWSYFRGELNHAVDVRLRCFVEHGEHGKLLH